LAWASKVSAVKIVKSHRHRNVRSHAYLARGIPKVAGERQRPSSIWGREGAEIVTHSHKEGFPFVKEVYFVRGKKEGM